MSEAIQDQALNYDGILGEDADKGGFTLLPEGDYPFRVEKFERFHFNGTEKMKACDAVRVFIDVGDAEVSTTIKHNLYLLRSQEWKLAEFFRAVGARKHGQSYRMDWKAAVGATGRCKVGVRKWKGREGGDMESNEVKKFYDPEAPAVTTTETAAGEQPF